MNKVFIKTLICLVALLIGGTLMIGCGGAATDTTTAKTTTTTPKVTTPATKHLAQSGIAFDYPSGWKTLTSDDPTRIAYLMGPDTSTVIQVIKAENTGFELKTYHDNLVIVLMDGDPISERSLTVAGLNAYETVFNFVQNNVTYQMRAVSVEKNGSVYSIFFSTAPASYDILNPGFNTVVSSFVID